jgi:hypothetical protein
VGIEPAAALRLHLEGGRQAQQLPVLALQLHEQPQARRAEQAEQAALRGEHPVDADVALRQHGMEDAAHPAGGRQRALVGQEVVAAAQQVAVRPLHEQLLGAQHDVAGLAGEEAQQLAVAPFLVAALTGEELAAGFRVEVEAGQRRRAREQAGSGRQARHVRRFRGLRLRQRQHRR